MRDEAPLDSTREDYCSTAAAVSFPATSISAAFEQGTHRVFRANIICIVSFLNTLHRSSAQKRCTEEIASIKKSFSKCDKETNDKLVC